MTERQPELFREFESYAQRRPLHKNLVPNKSLTLTLTYDRIIAAALGLILICGLIYIIGIEHGRGKKQAVAGVPQKTAAVQSEKAEPARPAEPAAPDAEAARPDPLYTIQIATFKSEALARKEIENAGDMGLRMRISEMNGYYQVWAGEFSKKEDAQRYAQKLKDRYKDCFIRKR
ncbi:MAG: SPOR domain-containing protein [Candidatus Omnitrophota bacterium]